MSKLASQSHASPWASVEKSELSRQSLDRDITVDICIIGAGMTGLSLAYVLSKQSNKELICLVDAAFPGQGETGNTSAHLASAIDDRFYKLEELFGQAGSFLAAESHRMAIDAIEAIVHQEQIACEFERVDGYLFAADIKQADTIYKEYEAALRAGFDDAELLDSTPTIRGNPGPCIRFSNQAQFHPLKYLKGLEQAVSRSGVEIYCETEVVSVDEGEIITVNLANGHTIRAKNVVVATNSPFNNRFLIHTKQHAFRSYVMEFEIAGGNEPKGLYWDTLDPYHYIRSRRVNDHQSLLLVGGEDHKTGQEDDPDACFAKLERWTRENFPEAGVEVKRWSGQILEPVDSLAFIGLNPGSAHKNVYIATGDSGNGLTHGMIAAILIDDLLNNRQNPWQKLYDPSRKNNHVEALTEFFKQNLNTALQYKDYVSRGDLSRESEIALGEGAVIRHGLQKRAVYRDHDNNLHSCSAICPHLGGVVRWNSFEKSWDCPCHGSRFDMDGNVINGPSVQGLMKISE